MSERQELRWWPAVAFLILFGGFLIWVWGFKDQSRQDNVMQSMAATFLVVILLLLWFLLASRAPWKWRVTALALAVLGGFAGSWLLTITGVSGDLVPIIGLKSSAEADRPTGAGEVQASGRLTAKIRGDYPQFLGPERNASVAAVALARDWDATPPREIWRREVGAAWSGFAIVADWAVTQEQHGEEEQVVAYELSTGKPLWRHADKARYDTTIGGVGPRATPTILDGTVYTMGAGGILNALDLETGRLLWSQDLLDVHNANNLEWGKSCSPLVVGDLVVASAGGSKNQSLVAYDRNTGDLAWAAGSDSSSYSSPILATLAGRQQILIRNQHSTVSHDPATGAVLWSEDWPAETPHVAVPLVLGSDRVLVSSGYGVGSKLYQVEEREGAMDVSVLWDSRRMKAKFTNLVEHEGFVYGLDDGIMVCLDPATGERCWKGGRYGHGQVILTGDLLLVTTEKGEVVLAEANADELRELGRIAPFEGKTWNPPALAGSLLLLRTAAEAVLLELPIAG